MQYYEVEPDDDAQRYRRVIFVLGLVTAALAATVVYLLLTRNNDDATATQGPATSSTVATTTVVVIETDAPVTPSETEAYDSTALVEDCVQYVPTAIYFGNADMQAFWDSGGGTPEGLRDACERLALEDPARLLRMSEEYVALVAAVATTTTP